MEHRHLNLTEETAFCPPAIDDIISRGAWRDWVDLREAIRKDRSLLADVERICENYLATSPPCPQRYFFWYNFVQKRKLLTDWDVPLSSFRGSRSIPKTTLIDGVTAALNAKRQASRATSLDAADTSQRLSEIIGQPQSALRQSAIAAIISRGSLQAWRDLRDALWKDKSLLDDIELICARNFDTPNPGRYHFWNYYAKTRKASS
ncbi:MAG: hypothetical protein LBO66_11475 [Deltaproteobacteria bacterium]|nr:hypothetical protein [Deltaproteobacteria bacterium]